MADGRYQTFKNKEIMLQKSGWDGWIQTKIAFVAFSVKKDGRTRFLKAFVWMVILVLPDNIAPA